MDQLRERASVMLQGGRITKFVYVDDLLGNTLVGREDCKLYVSEHLPEIDFIINKEVWEDQFEDWWRDTPVRERQERCISWGLEAENADGLKNKFEQILPNTIIQHYLTPQLFDQEKDNILADLDENHQLMILVDHKLEDYGRDGEDVLEQIAHRRFVNCAIFSGTFPIVEELGKWDSSQDKANIFLLSKERLQSEDDDVIIEGLRSVLWLKQISRIKNQIQSFFQDAFVFMKHQLDLVDPSTFHRVVLDRSEKEGCWEFETLLRFVNAYIALGIKGKMCSGGFTEFQLLTSSLRQIKNDASAHMVNEQIIKTIVEEEIYESSDYINKTYSQVCNGDIFKIGPSAQLFILLCQPCNLEIRTNGKRKREDFDQFYLIPIRDLADGEIPNISSFETELVSVGNNLRRVAELSHYFRISLTLLDLVSFNDEGKATINLKQTIENHPKRDIIQKNMMTRYGYIWKKINEYKKKYEMIHAAGFDKVEEVYLSMDFCRPFEMGDKKVAKHPKKVNGKIDVLDFQIERVGRYKDPYARDLLSHFMDYLSRPGYPMSLGVLD